MPFLLPVVLFIAGIVLVVKGGDLFVDAAGMLAKAAGVPPFLIGATIVSLATTLPEMIVSCMAASSGRIDMAIGNAVGSVTANTGMILSLAFIFMTVNVSRRACAKQCVLLLLSATVLWVGAQDGVLSIWACALLLAGFFVCMAYNVKDARAEAAVPDRPALKKGGALRQAVLFALGAVGIVAGSHFLVEGGSDIAAMLGVPERIIALTLVAVGTSLPELVTTLTAVRKNEAGLSIGNIVGANIIDLTLILPACSLISQKPLPVPAVSATLDIPVCLLVNALALLPVMIRQKSSKIQGMAMLFSYVVYIGMAL